MTPDTPSPSTDDIARVAYTIWESEGRPEGRDHDHWVRARQLLEEGRTVADLAPPAGGAAGSEARPVQPGFEDTPPGIVPTAKPKAAAELQEEPGGRFAQQLADLPDASAGKATGGGSETPGPRNPPPLPAANAEGYATVPSNEDAAAGAASDDPTPPPARPAGSPQRT